MRNVKWDMWMVQQFEPTETTVALKCELVDSDLLVSGAGVLHGLSQFKI